MSYILLQELIWSVKQTRHINTPGEHEQYVLCLLVLHRHIFWQYWVFVLTRFQILNFGRVGMSPDGEGTFWPYFACFFFYSDPPLQYTDLRSSPQPKGIWNWLGALVSDQKYCVWLWIFYVKILGIIYLKILLHLYLCIYVCVYTYFWWCLTTTKFQVLNLIRMHWN